MLFQQQNLENLLKCHSEAILLCKTKRFEDNWKMIA